MKAFLSCSWCRHFGLKSLYVGIFQGNVLSSLVLNRYILQRCVSQAMRFRLWAMKLWIFVGISQAFRGQFLCLEEWPAPLRKQARCMLQICASSYERPGSGFERWSCELVKLNMFICVCYSSFRNLALGFVGLSCVWVDFGCSIEIGKKQRISFTKVDNDYCNMMVFGLVLNAVMAI
jgi:hypothetical protein